MIIPSLVQSFSPFPFSIAWYANRKRSTGSGPSAERSGAGENGLKSECELSQAESGEDEVTPAAEKSAETGGAEAASELSEMESAPCGEEGQLGTTP
ncbi:hypothetical protein INR49_009010, partial [Caranx melampygus]